MRSPVYWHPYLYHVAMRLLYGRHYRARYAEIARRIKAGASVVDLCCGDCRLYTQELAGRAGSYLGLDFNAGFVHRARKRGIPVALWDCRHDPIPAADVVVLQGSLYQFMPDQAGMIERMIKAARQAVIVTEPIRNLSTSPNPLVAWVARRAGNPGSHPAPARFSESNLRDLFNRFPLRECVVLAGGRELLGVFDPGGRRA